MRKKVERKKAKRKELDGILFMFPFLSGCMMVTPLKCLYSTVMIQT